MPELARLNSVLLVHAELAEPIEKAAEELTGSDPKDYQTFLKSRPRESENQAVELMIRLCRETGREFTSSIILRRMFCRN